MALGGNNFCGGRGLRCRAGEPPDRLQLRLSMAPGRGIASPMFAPAIRSHFFVLALGVAAAPLAHLQDLLGGPAPAPALTFR